MPKGTLDRAIKKGAGLTGETVQFDAVMYEGFAPRRRCACCSAGLRSGSSEGAGRQISTRRTRRAKR